MVVHGAAREFGVDTVKTQTYRKMGNIYLHLNTRDEFMRIDISKIVYLEADGNYTNIVLANQLKGVVCMNLARMQQLLSERLKEHARIFVRVGKKHIINSAHIYRINVLRQQLVLSDGYRFAFALDVSKEALKALKDLMITARPASDHE